MSTKVDPSSALMIYCPKCGQPVTRTPNQLLAEPKVTCPACGAEYTPDLKELVASRQNLYDRFAELKKQIAEQKKDAE